MSRPSRFKAETKYGKSQDKKANRNLPVMARVGNGGGVVATAGRDNFYWIRLVNDDNRLTQCYSLLPLTNNDYIYVRRARDRDLSYYEFDKFIQGAGGTAPPTQVHDHADNAHGGQLDWDDIWTDAEHDHSSAAEGGDALNPETISSRCYVVGPSCPNTTLAAAVTDVNTAGPPAAGTEYVIKVLGRTTEAGDVTIPRYCHVEAETEGIVVDMQGNTLNLWSHTSLTHLTVTGTDATATVRLVNKYSDQSIRDCHIENTGNGAAVYADDLGGTAYIYDSTLDATNGDGLRIESDPTYSTTIIVNNCRISGGDDGFSTNHADCTVYTEYCIISGTNNDVNLAAGTWTYSHDDFDPDNCTVTGTAEPSDGQAVVYFGCTKTAGGGGDFATVQAAIDWFANRLLVGAVCKVDIATGATYNETLVIEDVFCAAEGRLELEGDTRGMAGATFVDNATITCQDASAGSGVCALANAGATITVTGAGGNPDFDADGWTSGTVIIRDNAGAIATHTISTALNNVITLTAAAPAVGNTGTSMTLVPNTVIAPSGAGSAVEVIESRGILLDGLHLDATAGATGHGLHVHDGGDCACENVLAEADDYGFFADWGAFIKADDGACTAVECAVGFYAPNQGHILADYGVAVGCSAAGFYGGYTGLVEANYGVVTDCVDGFIGQWLGGCVCQYAYSFQNTAYGFHAGRQGFVRCNDSITNATNGTDFRADYNAYMFANNTDEAPAFITTYSPAVTDTEGNVYGIITFS